MKIHTLFAAIFLLFIVTACYEDKGNYEYCLLYTSDAADD